MICKNCGNTIHDAARVCIYCGSSITETSANDKSQSVSQQPKQPISQQPPKPKQYSANPRPEMYSTVSKSYTQNRQTYRSNSYSYQLYEEDIFALIGIVLAFFIPIAGLIFSIWGLKSDDRHGIAVKGVIISVIFILAQSGILSLLYVFLF